MLSPLVVKYRNQRYKKNWPDFEIHPALPYHATHYNIDELHLYDLTQILLYINDEFFPNSSLQDSQNHGLTIILYLQFVNLIFLACIRQHIDTYSLSQLFLDLDEDFLSQNRNQNIRITLSVLDVEFMMDERRYDKHLCEMTLQDFLHPTITKTLHIKKIKVLLMFFFTRLRVQIKINDFVMHPQDRIMQLSRLFTIPRESLRQILMLSFFCFKGDHQLGLLLIFWPVMLSIGIKHIYKFINYMQIICIYQQQSFYMIVIYIITIDRCEDRMLLNERLDSAKNHFSHPSFIIGDWEPLGSQHPVLNEYLSSCVVTFVLAIMLYYTLTGCQYIICYIWKKQKYVPRRQQLTFQKQIIFHDIKWSFLNIVGQVPLISLVKLGYPYYSKIQYTFQLSPILLVYLLLHIIWDQFFTYWIHRLLHHPKIYLSLHSIHHQAKAITPFTGFAFHPLDAFLQALPVFTSCYFIPLPIDLILFHGFLTSVWAISIHDNMNMVPFKGILYAGSHSIHHFGWGINYNYGKFTSVCDRLYGTYCDPENMTGYGYKPNSSVQNVVKSLNNAYTSLIPNRIATNGLREVQKMKSLYLKKSK